MKKLLYTVSSILFGISSSDAQVIIGSDANSPKEKSYSVLEITTNEKKGFQTPVVALTDLGSTETPIVNPIHGMMVYNINSTIPQGLYFWDKTRDNGNGLWTQLADTSNIINGMLMNTTAPYNVLENVELGVPVSLLSDKFKVVTNQIGAEFNPSRGITLLGESGYFITLTLEIKADFNHFPNAKTSGADNTDVYIHNYTLEMKDENNKTVGEPQYVTTSSVAGKNDDSHSVTATFSFPIIRNPITLFPHISYGKDTITKNGGKSNGGNYFKGTPAGNTGKIVLKNVKMSIERGILAK